MKQGNFWAKNVTLGVFRPIKSEKIRDDSCFIRGESTSTAMFSDPILVNDYSYAEKDHSLVDTFRPLDRLLVFLNLKISVIVQLSMNDGYVINPTNILEYSHRV